MYFDTDENGEEIEVPSGEYELVADREHVVAVMVGDDRKFVFEKDQLTVIPEESFCRSCGQIGCGCNVYA